MKNNSLQRKICLIAIVAVSLFYIHSNASVSPSWANRKQRIEMNGMRYIIFDEPWEKKPVALVCGFDDAEENKRAYSGRLEIPDSITYEGVRYVVYGLFDHAFDGCSGMEELILPNTVKWLWSNSIANCGEINLKLPEGNIIENHYGVFQNTRVRQPFTLSPTFHAVNGYFFSAFPWIEEYTFSTFCRIIGADTFKESNISKIEFENDSIFLNCSEYDFRLILESYAFANSNLDEIKLPYGNFYIYNKAFSNQPQLKKLTFSETPRIYVAGYDMGDIECPNNYYLLIENCQNLEEIVCESITPPAIVGGLSPGDPQDHAIIMDDNSNTILKVPSGSEQLYAEHPVWGQFANISDINGNVYRTASLGDIQQTSQTTTKRIIVDGSSTLSVRLDAPSIVSVVNINGIEVCRESAEAGVFTAALAPGVYIVTVKKSLLKS